MLYREDLESAQLLDYINRVKAQVDRVPVGYVNAYYEFTDTLQLQMPVMLFWPIAIRIGKVVR